MIRIGVGISIPLAGLGTGQSGPGTGSGLLLEGPADSFLLLESGDYLLLEG